MGPVMGGSLPMRCTSDVQGIHNREPGAFGSRLDQDVIPLKVVMDDLLLLHQVEEVHNGIQEGIQGRFPSHEETPKWGGFLKKFRDQEAGFDQGARIETGGPHRGGTGDSGLTEEEIVGKLPFLFGGPESPTKAPGQ